MNMQTSVSLAHRAVMKCFKAIKLLGYVNCARFEVRFSSWNFEQLKGLMEWAVQAWTTSKLGMVFGVFWLRNWSSRLKAFARINLSSIDWEKACRQLIVHARISSKQSRSSFWESCWWLLRYSRDSKLSESFEDFLFRILHRNLLSSSKV